MSDQNYNNVAPQVPRQVHPKNGMAITSMVLGIVALCLFCFWYLSIPSAIVSIVLGVIATKAGKSGMAKTGIILSIIALVLVVLALTLLAGLIANYTNYNWMTY